MFSHLGAGLKFKRGDVERYQQRLKAKKSSSSKVIAPTLSLTARARVTEDVASNPVLEVEDEASFRETHEISVENADIVCLRSWSELASVHGLPVNFVKGIHRETGWIQPTSIQMATLPILLSRLRGKSSQDLLAASATGSGKTGAFVIPAVASCLEVKDGAFARPRPGISALIVSPTKELRSQTTRVASKLAASVGVKVIGIHDALKRLQPGQKLSDLRKYHVLSATPQHLAAVVTEQNDRALLGNLRYIAFDEGDELFHSQFDEQMKTIVDGLGPNTVRSLFSATISSAISEKVFQSAALDRHGTARVTIGAANTASSNVDHNFVFAGRETDKLFSLRTIFDAGITPPVLIFVNDKQRASELYSELARDGQVVVGVLSGDSTPQERQKTVDRLRTNELWALIVTDVAARGLDFKAVGAVINYDVPTNPVAYVHRTGRTGRQARGKAITLWTDADAQMMAKIAPLAAAAGSVVPEFLLRIDSKRAAKAAAAHRRRERVSTLPLAEYRQQQRRRAALARKRADTAKLSIEKERKRLTGRK